MVSHGKRQDRKGSGRIGGIGNELSMVSRSYDESKEDDGGKYQAD